MKVMTMGVGVGSELVSSARDPSGEPDGELTVRSGFGQVIDYIGRQRVAVDDGTPASKCIGWALLICLTLAAATLLVSHLTFGPRDTYLPDLSSTKQIPAIIVVASLVLIAAFLAVATWHSVTASPSPGRHFSGPLAVVTLVVVVSNALIGLSLLSTAALLRTRAHVFAQQPSLVRTPVGDSDICLALGLAVVMACALLLAVTLLASQHRTVAAVLAGAPALACAVAYMAADRDVLALSEWAAKSLAPLSSPDQVRFLVATPAEHIATAPLLVLVLASAAGIGLLVSFGTVEFVDAKAKLSRGLLAGRQISDLVLAAFIAAFAIAVISARFGWLPDGKSAVLAFFKTSIESWVLAAFLAAVGLWVLRASRRRPLEQRNPRLVVAVACVALVAGNVVAFLSLLFQQLAEPIVARDAAVGRFIFERFPSWSLWAQDWVTISVAAALGVWGLYRLLVRHERSDRVVFAVAFGAVTFQLQLSTILYDHWASKDLGSFSAATPEQIVLCAVAFIAVAALARRPVLDNRSAALVVAVVFLVTLGDAVVPNTFSANVFQLLLIAPFAYRFLFDSQESHRDPRRGAITVAAIGLLFIAEAAAIAVGLLDSGRFEINEFTAFFQLTAPLALLMLCVTAAKGPLPPPAAGDPVIFGPVPFTQPPPGPVTETEPKPARTSTSRRAWRSPFATGATLAFGAFLMIAVMFTMIRMPGKPDRGVYRIDLATLPARYTPTQTVAATFAEQVTILRDDNRSFILIHHGSTAIDANLAHPCSDDTLVVLFGVPAAMPLAAAGTLAGMPAQSTTVTDASGTYLVTCATDVDAAGVGRVILIAELDEQTALSSDAKAIIGGLRFSTGSVPGPVTRG